MREIICTPGSGLLAASCAARPLFYTLHQSAVELVQSGKCSSGFFIATTTHDAGAEASQGHFQHDSGHGARPNGVWGGVGVAAGLGMCAAIGAISPTSVGLWSKV